MSKSRLLSLRSWLAAAAALAFLVSLAHPAAASPAAPPGKDKTSRRSGGGKAKLPSPSKHLKLALRNLAKTKSYAVSLRVEGGISENQKHEVSKSVKRYSYTGEVFGNKLMHVPDLKAYRTAKKGVRYSSGEWRNVLSDQTGTLMDRLFGFPLDVVTKAYRHSRTARWVESAVADEEERGDEESGGDLQFDDDDDDDEDEDDESSDAKDEKKDEPKGRTVVASDRTKEAKVKLPSVIRVEAPPKEALTHFLAVEKSGCIGGG